MTDRDREAHLPQSNIGGIRVPWGPPQLTNPPRRRVPKISVSGPAGRGR